MLPEDRVRGAKLVSSYKVYADGWCAPACVLALKPHGAATELILKVWIMPEERVGRHVVELRIEGSGPEVYEVECDTLTELRSRCVRDADQMAICAVRCNNVVANTGVDPRRLSFILDSVVLS